MAITFIGSVKSGGAAGFTTAALNTSGANFLIATIATGGGTASISDSLSNTWTPLTKQGAGGGALQFFYVTNPAVGAAHTFTIGTAVNMSVEVLAFAGVDTTAPFDVENGASSGGVTTGQPGSVTPGSDNEVVISAASIVQDTTVLSVDSGLSAVIQQNYSAGTFYGSGTAYLIQTTAAAVNPTWSATVALGIGSLVIATFKAGAGGGVAAVVDGPRGDTRPFPFTPGSAQQRM